MPTIPTHEQFQRKAVAVPDNQANAATIYAARKAAGLSQSNLAGAVGITQGYLCDLERGTRNISEEMFAKLLNAINNQPTNQQP